MKEKWYWIELIGFDADAQDFNVKSFLEKIEYDIKGINILFSSIDFVNCHKGMQAEYLLTEGDCSYGGHEYNEERRLQLWTNYRLRDLISELHKYGVKVVFSFFNFSFYRKLDGEIYNTGFVKENPNIKERVFNGEERDCVLPIKRLDDGSFYDDYIAKKVKEIIFDYGFDGVVYADGISSIRHPVQMADYSDDLVEQFENKTGIVLPADLDRHCNFKPKAYEKRRKYIFENLQFEWLEFISKRFGEFFNKQLNALKGTDKIFMFNSAWTKSVFEAFLRYGLDYSLFNDERIYAVMVEDCGSIQPVYSDFDQGGIHIPFSHRKYLNNFYLSAQMEMKIAMPRIKHISMCTLKDNAEQWNVVDDMPTEFKKGVLRRSLASFISDNMRSERVSSGAMYCLSDGISKNIWDKVSKTEALEEALKDMQPQGFVWLSNPDVKSEVKDYIAGGKYSQSIILEELLNRKVLFSSSAGQRSVKYVNSPMIMANARFFGKECLSVLSCVNDLPFFVFDYENAIAKKPDYTLYYGDGSGLKLYAFNVGFSGNENADENFITKKPPYYHKFNNIWTYRLQYQSVSKRFLFRAAEILSEISSKFFSAPKQTANCDVNLRCYKNGNRYALFVQNNEYHISSACFEFSERITAYRILSKPFWYEIRVEDNKIYPKIPTRGAEIIIVDTEKS